MSFRGYNGSGIEMKVLVKSERVPVVLMVMGLSMATVSQMSFVESNSTVLFLAGWVLAGLGFLLWAIPNYVKYLKKRERAMRKMERTVSSDPDQQRRYARPRR
jgi:hypothetical protein